MPNRIIRGDILDSERYWAVTIEARQLALHLMLVADDFGCVSLAPVLIRRRCFDDAPSQSKITRLIEQLVEVDLLRVYQVNNANYGFIPRFRQKLRIMKPKYPAPPESLYSDDSDAKEKFKLIKGESSKMTDGCSTTDGHPSPEVKLKGKGIEKESEVPVKSAKQWAAELGIQKQPDEGEAKFQIRVAAVVAKHKLENPNAVTN